MMLRVFRDHLPWVAPTAAVAFSAFVYFDRQSGSETAANAYPAVQPQSVTYDVSGSEDMVTRLATVTDSSLRAVNIQPSAEMDNSVATALQNQIAPAAAPAPVPAPVVAAVPAAPVTPEPVQIASVSNEETLNFFAEAQARLQAQESCIADLRALTSDAFVYFPAGGLTADEGGLSLARLIGSLAQDCEGVEIIVEGHSDPSGDPAANLRLSQKRAELVVQRLGASGLDTTRFVAKGMGDKVPSNVTGDQSSAYYDRRVEFVVHEVKSPAKRNTFNTAQSSWGAPDCAKDLEAAIQQTTVTYAPRSIAVSGEQFGKAYDLARMAAACDGARLRVIGQHSDEMRAGESVSTGILRAKAMMSMLVGKGIDSGQIIIAAPSRSMRTAELTGSRVDFDVIID